MLQKIKDNFVSIVCILIISIPVVLFILAAIYLKTKNKKVILYPKFQIVDIIDNQQNVSSSIMNDVVTQFGSILNKMKGIK